jgi:hypothetical protein
MSPIDILNPSLPPPPLFQKPVDPTVYKVKHMTTQSTGSRDSWSSTGSDVDMPVQVGVLEEIYC